MTAAATPTTSSEHASQLRVAQLMRPYWMTLSIAGVAVVGETLTDVLEPWPVKVVVDSVLQSKPLTGWFGDVVFRIFGHNALAVLNFAVFAVVLIAVLGAISTYVESYLTNSVGQWVAHDLRRMLYHHIQRLSLAEHDHSQTGDMISRVTKDTDAVQEFINSALLGIFVDLLTLGGMVGVMFYLDWRFTLMALLVAPVLFLVVFTYTRRIKAASRAVRKKESELLSRVAEVLSSIHVVQAFAREDYEEKRFESESVENVQLAVQAKALKAKLSPITEVIVAVGTSLVLWYGARRVLSGGLSVGVLIVFLLYLSKMYKPMRDLSKMSDTVSKAVVARERILEVLNVDSRVRDLPGARRAPRFRGRIEFSHVTFGYADGTTVLNDLNVRIESGQFAAIVGPSGTGKTTMVSLIPRFYDPVSGDVRIDGTDIRKYTLKSLRDQISLILQDTLLFRATIRDNIAYGRPTASFGDVRRAAELANAHEFIESMPQGYDTIVGERGATLSGGQRQRISIARALIRNTPILILDEPTASLDAASEQSVITALERLMKSRTSVFIAHHLAAIRHADLIFVVSDAGIVEQGTHDALMAMNGVYADLYNRQSSEAAIAEPQEARDTNVVPATAHAS
ncbi:MAG TPA: ABC transporter ATP-binding protein [Vicinamibacterales bacterium]|nr:ABC transporter ATP-binding protein [Vicinamibacterales bacterium]